jgi:SAM-dependent methyltransferase
MKNRLKVHAFDWTEQRISRFWNAIYELAPPGSGFSENTAETLINYVKSKIDIKGNFLDYGTGNGYLMKILLENYPDSKISGCDSSPESVEMVKQHFKYNKNYDFCFRIEQYPLPVKDRYFDIIFALEVIEHLNNRNLEVTLSEFGRILKKDGILIITVPNNEDLESRKVICPECGAIFHPIQHIQSFNKARLLDLLSSKGFKALLCRGINIDYLLKRDFVAYLKNFYYWLADKSPNLIFIGVNTGV